MGVRNQKRIIPIILKSVELFGFVACIIKRFIVHLIDWISHVGLKYTIIADSREKEFLQFSDLVSVEIAALPAADYSIRGFETEIAIERKSLSDLLGSITHNRDRFTRELRQLRSYRFAALVIEASWKEILVGAYRSQMHPNAVLASLMSFTMKYGIMVILADDHATAGRLVESLLTLWCKYIERDARALERAAAPKIEKEIADDANP